MTPLREWLKPPRTLLLFLFLLTLVSVSALSWFGWKVLDQERMVEAQRLQQRVEQSADRIAATLRGALAETGELLGASSITPPGRMEAGARPFRFEELDAAALVRRVAAEFEGHMAAAGRHIEIDSSPPRCPIEADPEAISAALRNLVDNAIKYSPGHPTIWVEWAQENDCVAIRVRDQGPGIARSERKAIFRRFVRGSAAAAANVRGSGLGLAMVRHIVTAHGGAITLASQPGQGSTFTIFLPAMERA